MSSVVPAKSRPTLKKLWQIPVLLAGVGVFMYGLYSFRKTVPVVPFKDHVHEIRLMVDNKQYDKALKSIAEIQNYFPEKEEQRELNLLKGDAFYYAQQDQALVKDNYKKAVEFYDIAERYGLDEHDSEYLPMQERWASSQLEIGDTDEGLARLERVVEKDPARLARHAHRLVDGYLDLKVPNINKAVVLLNRVARSSLSGVDDRVWALCKKIELAIEDRGLDSAIEEANRAVGEIAERNPSGILLTWIGRGYFARGDLDKAREKLNEARRRFVVHNLDDGRAALLLGKIAQARSEFDIALKLYQEVVTSHAGTSIMAAARLGRAEIRSLGKKPDEATMVDFDFVVSLLTEEKHEKLRKKQEFISREAVRATLALRQQEAQDQERYEDSLTYLKLIQKINDEESADFAFRMATTYEKLGDELEKEIAHVDSSERQELFQKALDHYNLAAKAYQRHSKLATLNIPVSAASLWRAAQLYDRAGQPDSAIGAYQQYIHELPRDARVPEALHAIGQLYQSRGQLDQAIPYFQRNMRENSKSPAAYLSTVQLARCYMAQGEEQFPKAETALLSIVQDNPNLLPVANEFRISLFTLGELYYRTKRWSDAILRLEEALSRYPEDKQVPRATFWLAECYRKSSNEIAEAIKKDPQIEKRDSLETSRQDRLRRSGMLFSQVINLLDPDPMHPLPLDEMDQDYLEYSYLYRADCLFDLGDFAGAVKLYDTAATRFTQSITAIDAYVQIVNSYTALKQPAQAAAAAERARWLLKRVPDDAFKRGVLGLDRKYYDKFFRLGRADK